MLDLQILALTLIPLFAAIVPAEGDAPSATLALLGMDEPITSEFLTGTWKSSDEFVRWGFTDRERSRIKPFKGNSYMSLRSDGSMTMLNFFRPQQGRWELTDRGLLIHDPKHPERGTQILTVRKRDKDRIWLLLPFSGGSTGIGMVRVPDDEPDGVQSKEKSSSVKHHRTRSRPKDTLFSDDKPLEETTPSDKPIESVPAIDSETSYP